MVCAVDHLAAQAGVALMRAGGDAVDAAVGTSAVLAVTTQHLCGMGGDLFALVHRPDLGAPAVLNASGRAGSGADPDRLRDQGHAVMPAKGDVRSIPVPGCVDGWTTLHERFGRLPLADVLAPAVDYASHGFPASHLLAATAGLVAGLPGGSDFAAATHPGAIVRRPGVARALQAVTDGGRAAFYQGEFGDGLLRLGAGEYTPADLAAPLADWVEPLVAPVWGRQVWTVPPNSQGYLTLAGAAIAAGLDLPPQPDDPLWAHLLVESARQAGFDRLEVLSESADGRELVSEARLGPRRAAIRPDQSADLRDSYAGGGTMYMCAVDPDGNGVSLIQSNAAGFGAHIAEPSTGIFLHNRGTGFNLIPGHPAEYRPGRRPPHTLSPALVTTPAGRLDLVIGTMGGDSQPQVLLQLLARILHTGEELGDAIAAPHWMLESIDEPTGFNTWTRRGHVQVALEPGTPPAWAEGLAGRGHRVAVAPGNYGHAHAIRLHDDHLEGAYDPRTLAGDATGF
jgi:gamma-glutamyltranspeptidase/glutathione hydrolase